MDSMMRETRRARLKAACDLLLPEIRGESALVTASVRNMARATDLYGGSSQPEESMSPQQPLEADIGPGEPKPVEPESHFKRMNDRQRLEIRPFELLALPQELRDHIYDLVIHRKPKHPQLVHTLEKFYKLGYGIAPLPKHCITLHPTGYYYQTFDFRALDFSEEEVERSTRNPALSTQGASSRTFPTVDIRLPEFRGLDVNYQPRHFALFRTCRQVYEESKLRLYGISTFRLTTFCHGARIREMLPEHFNIEYIERLRLEFLVNIRGGRENTDFSVLGRLLRLKKLEVGLMDGPILATEGLHVYYPTIDSNFRQWDRSDHIPGLIKLLEALICEVPRNVDIEWVERVWWEGVCWCKDRVIDTVPFSKELLEEHAAPLMNRQGEQYRADERGSPTV